MALFPAMKAEDINLLLNINEKKDITAYVRNNGISK